MQGRNYAIAIAILCLAGLAATVYLTYLHLVLFTSGLGQPSICGISRRISCEIVSASPYSSWLGVPVAWIGCMFYVLVGTLATMSFLKRGENASSYAAVMFWLAGLAVAIDIYFALVMAFSIRSLCLLCVLTYVINIVIVVLAYRASPRPLGEIWAAAAAHLAPRRRGAPAVLLALLAVALIGGGGAVQIRKIENNVLASFNEASYLSARANMARLAIDTTGDPHMGPDYAALTIIEFSDFQCPHCRRAHHLMEALLPAYLDRVKFVFKNFPLGRECNEHMRKFPGDLHPAACSLARLGEAAAEQGRFWPMHDAMFAVQPDLPKDRALTREEMLALGDKAGLDRTRLEQSLSADRLGEAVAADVRAGQKAAVGSTPTFFLNGIKIEGLPSLPVMKRLIDIELEKAGSI